MIRGKERNAAFVDKILGHSCTYQLGGRDPSGLASQRCKEAKYNSRTSQHIMHGEDLLDTGAWTG